MDKATDFFFGRKVRREGFQISMAFPILFVIVREAVYLSANNAYIAAQCIACSAVLAVIKESL